MESLQLAIYAILISFLVGVIICPLLIPVLHRLKFGQTERGDGPQSHLKKNGTPTMGGIAILSSFLITGLFFLNFNEGLNKDGLVVILVTLGFGLIGFIDDYIKVVKKRSLGLKPLQKIVGQCIITIIFLYYCYNYADIGTDVLVPFLKDVTIPVGILYIPFVFVVMLGTVNGVNLTDGLDGLASGVTLIVAAFFLMASWSFGSGIMPIAGAVIGSLFAFLIFNAYPARVFMGDTGSLALGGFVAATALLLRMPVYIVLVGFIYLLESVSVILQVGYYKKTKKRIFKMAPIHHHFELSGWSETKVVTVFYITTAMLCLIGFLGMN